MVIAGLIIAYVPFLFYRPEPQVNTQENYTASITPPSQIESTSTSGASIDTDAAISPEGFSGLSEEDKSLQELEDLLDQSN